MYKSFVVSNIKAFLISFYADRVTVTLRRIAIMLWKDAVLYYLFGETKGNKTNSATSKPFLKKSPSNSLGNLYSQPKTLDDTSFDEFLKTDDIHLQKNHPIWDCYTLSN